MGGAWLAGRLGGFAHVCVCVCVLCLCVCGTSDGGVWPRAACIIGAHAATARAHRYGAVEWVALPADKCQGKRQFDLVALTNATSGGPKVAPVARTAGVRVRAAGHAGLGALSVASRDRLRAAVRRRAAWL